MSTLFVIILYYIIFNLSTPISKIIYFILLMSL
nr:MAG TPA: hypothetical protein [Caudoviricetes sp.]